MHCVKLIHWKPEEIKERTTVLEAAGYQVDPNLEAGSKIIQQLGNNPPEAVLIDLSRLPSQGRDFALLIRKRKSSRHIPLVFIGGDPQKVEGIMKLIPDASYTSWEEIGPTLERAIANPPDDPIVHESTFAGYAGKSLPEKLGIKAKMTVALVNPPRDFTNTLGNLPDGVQIQKSNLSNCDLTIWFCVSVKDLDAYIQDIVSQSSYGPFWIAWPKKKSGLRSDLTQQLVRQTGLENNLVDYKICSIDETWSGLLFKYRERK
ncbi:MAG: hypothetical protein ABUK20_14815 [Anaerolineales bacterium]